jgi:anthranilate phosphoribosyltransferase
MAPAFSEFTRIIGRGPTLSRPLTRDEACAAMTQVLDGAADPVALGGFLLVLRQRGETAEELAGFVDAVKARLSPPAGPPPDVDWPTYADKHRQQPWFVLAALLLARAGIRVLMHGIAGEGDGCAPTRPALTALGISPAKNLEQAEAQIAQGGFAYIGLEAFSPETEALFHLKPVLGVRSVANTFARDLNPLNARFSILGIVHSPYRPLHIEALRLLGQENAAVFKGVGGEAQRNPFKAGTVALLTDGKTAEEEWPAGEKGDAFLWREEDLSPDRVAALWRGDIDHPAAEASIVQTAAVALKSLGRAETAADAEDLARTLWRGRHAEAAPAAPA